MRQTTAAAVAALTLMAASAGLAGCASSTSSSSSTSTTASAGTSTSASAASCTFAGLQSELYTKGVLTVATDQPAYPPWFENNKPSNGQGYESAVAYTVAAQLGFKPAQVKWAYEPFNASYAPGNKKFDFDINEISYTAARAQVVTFSNSYYDVQQSIIALKGSKIVKDHTPAELKTYQYGDQVGTTGLLYIDQHIKPTKTTRVYNTLDNAASALEAHEIDAIVLDTPDGQYMASSDSGEVVNAKGKNIAVQVGQFPSTGEHYGLLFQKGNKL